MWNIVPIEKRYTEYAFVITLGGRARFWHSIRVFLCMASYTKSDTTVTHRPRYKSQLRTHHRTTDSTCFSSTRSTHSTKVRVSFYWLNLGTTTCWTLLSKCSTFLLYRSIEMLKNKFILAFTLLGSEFHKVDPETEKHLDTIFVLTVGMKTKKIMWPNVQRRSCRGA